jgi:hypothetical protein
VGQLVSIPVAVVRLRDSFVEHAPHRLAGILDWYVCICVHDHKFSLKSSCVATENRFISDVSIPLGRLYLSHLPVAVGTHFIFKRAHAWHAEFRACLFRFTLCAISNAVDFAPSGAGLLTSNDDVAFALGSILVSTTPYI